MKAQRTISQKLLQVLLTMIFCEYSKATKSVQRGDIPSSNKTMDEPPIIPNLDANYHDHHWTTTAETIVDPKKHTFAVLTIILILILLLFFYAVSRFLIRLPPFSPV